MQDSRPLCVLCRTQKGDTMCEQCDSPYCNTCWPVAHNVRVPILASHTQKPFQPRGLRVAVVYNLKRSMIERYRRQPEAEGRNEEVPEDRFDEYDSMETVDGIANALRSHGHEAVLVEADENFYFNIQRANVDICFNIAEGLHGESRESHVPAMLELLGIPYTAAGVMGHAIKLDKGMCKRVWRDHGLRTSPFQVFSRTPESEEELERILQPDMKASFPLFVKPMCEGSGMGVNDKSRCPDIPALFAQIRWVVDKYRQPALVEAFLPGREFTMTIVGNATRGSNAHHDVPSTPETWHESATSRPPTGGFWNARGFHVMPVEEIDPTRFTPEERQQGSGVNLSYYGSHLKTALPLGTAYYFPQNVPAELERELMEMTMDAFEAIGARDLSRVDFKIDREGRPTLIEINTLPGVNPTYSDLTLAITEARVPYPTFINMVLELAIERHPKLYQKWLAIRAASQ